MYKYGMRSRPYAIGCQPDDGLIEVNETNKRLDGYHAELTYNRELTDDELYQYELKDLVWKDYNEVKPGGG